MTKIKVKIDAQPPARELARKHKNYSRFMDNYRKYYSTGGIRHMLYNDRKKLTLIVILIVFLLLLLFSNDANANSMLYTVEEVNAVASLHEWGNAVERNIVPTG